jgi:predicted ABC-type transport system involved in lysophospholipase L1 biosynthesis ATPase subunit
MRDPFRSVIRDSIEGLYGALQHKPRPLSGGEQAEGNAATAEAAVRVVGGWDVGDDAA